MGRMPYATTRPAGEAFQTVVAPGYDKVVRGVSYTPALTSGRLA
jgi:hypothetical protein